MSIRIKPLGNRVVLEPIEQERTTASGIALPETAKEKTQEGAILAVGPGRRTDKGKRITLELAVGDRVLFSKYAGSEVKLLERKLLVLEESEVLAILDQ